MTKLMKISLISVLLATGAMASELIVEKGGTFNIARDFTFVDGSSIINYGTLNIGNEDESLSVELSVAEPEYSAKIVNKSIELEIDKTNSSKLNLLATGAQLNKVNSPTISSQITITNEGSLELTEAQNSNSYTVDMTSTEAGLTVPLSFSNLGDNDNKALNVKFIDGTNESLNSHAIQILGDSNITIAPYMITVLTLNSDMSNYKNGKLIISENSAPNPIEIKIGDTNEINCDVDIHDNGSLWIPAGKELTIGGTLKAYGQGDSESNKGILSTAGKLIIKGTVTLGA